MAASTKQGKHFTLFLVGLTVACAGLATLSTSLGKMLLIVGIVLFVASCIGFLMIKPEEGNTAQRAGGEAGKLGGALVAGLGWVVTVIGLQFVTSNGGRIILSLVGIVVSLFGILYILPTVLNRNAIWKA